MAEEIIARLEGFSPSPGKLERDQMVYNIGFAAGRTGRCHRAWRWLSWGLGLTQIMLLSAWTWLANPTSSNPPLVPPPADIPLRNDDPLSSPFRPNSLSALPRLTDDGLPDYVPELGESSGSESTLNAGTIPDLLIQSY